MGPTRATFDTATATTASPGGDLFDTEEESSPHDRGQTYATEVKRGPKHELMKVYADSLLV